MDEMNQGAPAGSQGAPPSQSKYIDDETPNVSPEEQAEYEEFMKNVQTLIYADVEEGTRVRPEILQALQGAGQAPAAQDAPPQGADPQAQGQGNPAVMALAHTAVTLVTQIDDSARKAGRPISDDVLQEGALDTIRELSEVATNANIHDFKEQDIMGAYVQAIDMYRPKLIEDGRTSEETLKGQFAELSDADAAGKLGDILPGMGGATVGEPPVQPQQ